MGRAIVFDAAPRGIGPGGSVRAVERPTTILMMMMMVLMVMMMIVMVVMMAVPLAGVGAFEFGPRSGRYGRVQLSSSMPL